MKKKLLLLLMATSILSFLPSVSHAMTQQEYEAYIIRKKIMLQREQQEKNDIFRAGIEAYQQKNYEYALRLLSRVENDFIRRKDFNIAFGNSLYGINNKQAAINYLGRAYQMGATDYPTLTNLAYGLMDIQNYSKAYPVLAKAISYYPTEPDPYWNLALTCDKLQNQTCTLNSLLRLTKVKPDYSPEPYLMAGDIYKQRQNIEQSLGTYLAGLSIYSKNPQLNYFVGDIYFAKGFTDKSIPYFLQAVDSQPDYLDAYYLLGGAYLKLDDLDKSATVCDTMAKVAPKDEKTQDICKAVDLKQTQKLMEQQMMIDQMTQDQQMIMEQQDMQNQTMHQMGTGM